MHVILGSQPLEPLHQKEGDDRFVHRAVRRSAHPRLPKGAVYSLLELEVPGAGAVAVSPEVLARWPWIDSGDWNLRPERDEAAEMVNLGIALDLEGEEEIREAYRRVSTVVWKSSATASMMVSMALAIPLA